jgi:hypothetical protein
MNLDIPGMCVKDRDLSKKKAGGVPNYWSRTGPTLEANQRP